MSNEYKYSIGGKEKDSKWLTDANIDALLNAKLREKCNILDTTSKVRTESGLPNIVIASPIKLGNIGTTEDAITGVKRLYSEEEVSYIVPINFGEESGSHWIMGVINQKKDGTVNITVADSYGESEKSKEARKEFQEIFRDATVEDKSKKQQNDDWACGYIAVENAVNTVLGKGLQNNYDENETTRLLESAKKTLHEEYFRSGIKLDEHPEGKNESLKFQPATAKNAEELEKSTKTATAGAKELSKSLKSVVPAESMARQAAKKVPATAPATKSQTPLNQEDLKNRLKEIENKAKIAEKSLDKLEQDIDKLATSSEKDIQKNIQEAKGVKYKILDDFFGKLNKKTGQFEGGVLDKVINSMDLSSATGVLTFAATTIKAVLDFTSKALLQRRREFNRANKEVSEVEQANSTTADGIAAAYQEQANELERMEEEYENIKARLGVKEQSEKTTDKEPQAKKAVSDDKSKHDKLLGAVFKELQESKKFKGLSGVTPAYGTEDHEKPSWAGTQGKSSSTVVPPVGSGNGSRTP